MSYFMSPTLHCSDSAVPSIPPTSVEMFLCLLSLAGHKEDCEAVDYLLMELHRMTVLDLTANVEDSFKWLLEQP
jgi:hypothetical protein